MIALSTTVLVKMGIGVKAKPAAGLGTRLGAGTDVGGGNIVGKVPDEAVTVHQETCKPSPS